MLLNYRMRFYIILFFFVSVFFIGCGSNDDTPAGILKMHDMAELLTDIHIVDGNLYNVSQMPDSLASHGMGLYMAVLKVHHTDTVQFKKSMKYYSLRPDKLNTIYDGVVRRLTKKVDSLQQIQQKAPFVDVKVKHKQDSIAQLRYKIPMDLAQIARVSIMQKAKPVKKHKSKKKKKKKKHALPTK